MGEGQKNIVSSPLPSSYSTTTKEGGGNGEQKAKEWLQMIDTQSRL